MSSTWWKSKLFRLVVLGLILASVIYLPWWLSLIIALAAIAWIDDFYEVAVAGLLFDLLYGLGTDWWSVRIPVALLSVLLVFLATRLKKNLLVFN